MYNLRNIKRLSFLFLAILISAGVEVSAQETGRNSPFGAHGAFARPFVEPDKAAQHKILHSLSEVKEPFRYVQDIGIKWVRPGADIYWPAVQPTPETIKNGVFDWESVDTFFGKVPQGVNILATIDALSWGVNVHPAFKPGTWQFIHEAAERDYIKFVKEVVERYDGDGLNDMPGLKNPIKYWQIGNEPALRPLKGIKDANRELDWKGFSRLVEISYKAIKESDAGAKVALAGLAAGYPSDLANDLFFRKMCLREREEFYIPLLENLQGRYIDIFDIHYYGVIEKDGSVRPEGWGWEGMKQAYDFFRRKLDENGYKDTEIWFTETAAPSAPFGERFQAINLVKRFVYPLTFGVKKVFWWNMIEGEYPLEEEKPSNNFGLIYDGVGKGDPGYGVKKLAYYTYKKMVEVLEGSDWNNIEIVRESGGIYIYKFNKNGRPVWVAWNENKETQEINIKATGLAKVKITKAVPESDSAFEAKDTPVIKGKVSFLLTEIPIFISPDSF